MKLQMLVIVMVLLWMVLSIMPLGADPTVKDYVRYKERPTLAIYITGVGDGLLWANAELITRKQKPLYCQPGEFVLHTDNYLEILNRKMKDEKFTKHLPADFPLARVLLRALQEIFPCDE